MSEEVSLLPEDYADEAYQKLQFNESRFARAVFEMMDGIEKSNASVSKAEPQTPERLRQALQLLDLRAQAFLKLVLDLELLNAD